jgi:nucleotide-binding universal stress UspA family protein
MAGISAESLEPTGGDRTNRPTVVVGVDGSDHARWALKWAADEAHRRGSLLRIVYGETCRPEHLPAWYLPGSGLSPGEAIIDDAVALVATRYPSVLTSSEVVDWPPGLVLAVASRNAQLLVVGARGSGGFQGLLLGSVSEQCIQYAHCPVVVVRGDPDAGPHRPGGYRIVVGLDGSLGSTRALEWALEEAGGLAASVEAVYGWDPPLGSLVMGPEHGSELVAREVVEAAGAQARRVAPAVSFTARTEVGRAVAVLLDACRGADQLVVGSHGHGRLWALLGSVPLQCVRRASCAVVVVRRHEGMEAPSGRPVDDEVGTPSLTRRA